MGAFRFLHMGIAAFAIAEFRAIGDDELKELAQSFADWQAFHKVKVNPETLAMLTFLGVAGSTYTPVMSAWMMRKTLEKQAAAQQANARTNGFGPTIVNLDPRGNG